MVMIEAPDEVNQLIHSFLLSNLNTQESQNNNTNHSGDTEVPESHLQRAKSRQSQRTVKSGKGLRRSHTQNLLSKSFKK